MSFWVFVYKASSDGWWEKVEGQTKLILRVRLVIGGDLLKISYKIFIFIKWEVLINSPFPTWRSLQAKRCGNCPCSSCICNKMSWFSPADTKCLKERESFTERKKSDQETCRDSNLLLIERMLFRLSYKSDSNSIHHRRWCVAQSEELSPGKRNVPGSNPGRSLGHSFRLVIPHASLSLKNSYLFNTSDLNKANLTLRCDDIL